MATIRIEDLDGNGVLIDGEEELHVEFVNAKLAASEKDLLFYEPIRIFSAPPSSSSSSSHASTSTGGHRGKESHNRKWLVPMKVMSKQSIAGMEGTQLVTGALPGPQFKPIWRSLPEIAEAHLPMQWMIQPGLFDENRKSLKGTPVRSSRSSRSLLVGLSDAMGGEQSQRIFGLDGTLHKDPLKVKNFEGVFGGYILRIL